MTRRVMPWSIHGYVRLAHPLLDLKPRRHITRLLSIAIIKVEKDTGCIENSDQKERLNEWEGINPLLETALLRMPSR